MRVPHIYDSSFVFHYVLDLLYTGKVLVVSDIAYKFDYHKSTVYKIIHRIEYSLLFINPNFELVCISPGCYKFISQKH